MHLRRLLLTLVALNALGCRAKSVPADAGPQAAAAAPSTAGQKKASAVGSVAAAPAAPAWPAYLPKLKPVINKPFPEGADEATVCEAIDSKMPDLWVRFGHILPVFYQGAVYVLETGPETKAKLYDFVANKYVYGYDSRQASCRGELTLLYIRNMYESSEFKGKPFGREHLSQELEAKLGIKTRESFLFKPDEQRLSEYCRADAVLCDKLVRLDWPQASEGLCGDAIIYCPNYDSRNSATRRDLLAACRKVPLATLACLRYRGTNREQFTCRDRVNASVCPDASSPLP